MDLKKEGMKTGIPGPKLLALSEDPDRHLFVVIQGPVQTGEVWPLLRN